MWPFKPKTQLPFRVQEWDVSTMPVLHASEIAEDKLYESVFTITLFMDGHSPRIWDRATEVYSNGGGVSFKDEQGRETIVVGNVIAVQTN